MAVRKHYFKTLSGATTFTISRNDGVKECSILVDIDSTASLTVAGDSLTIGGIANDANMTFSAGQAFTFGDGDNDINYLLLTVPAGCTVYLTGVIYGA